MELLTQNIHTFLLQLRRINYASPVVTAQKIIANIFAALNTKIVMDLLVGLPATALPLLIPAIVLAAEK